MAVEEVDVVKLKKGMIEKIRAAQDKQVRDVLASQIILELVRSRPPGGRNDEDFIVEQSVRMANYYIELTDDGEDLTDEPLVSPEAGS